MWVKDYDLVAITEFKKKSDTDHIVKFTQQQQQVLLETAEQGLRCEQLVVRNCIYVHLEPDTKMKRGLLNSKYFLLFQ